jgi:hypothetical protein
VKLCKPATAHSPTLSQGRHCWSAANDSNRHHHRRGPGHHDLSEPAEDAAETAGGADTVTLPVLSTDPVLLALIANVIGGRTWTTKDPVATFPEWSVAVQVTVVDPTGKNEPDSGVHATVGLGSRSSEAETEYVTFMPDPSRASTVVSSGRFRTGAVTSGGGGGFDPDASEQSRIESLAMLLECGFERQQLAGRREGHLVDVELPSQRVAATAVPTNASSCPTDDHHFVALGVGDPPAIL